MYAFLLVFLFISRSRKLIKCEHKIIHVCQIIGPAAAGSAGPVPTPVFAADVETNK